MKIKIIKGNLWYMDRVGEIFEVGQHIDKEGWKVIIGNEKGFPIWKLDTEIVEEIEKIEKGCMTCKNGTRNKGCMCWDEQCTHGVWEKWQPIKKEVDQYIDEVNYGLLQHDIKDKIESVKTCNNCDNCGYTKPCERCRNYVDYPKWIPSAPFDYGKIIKSVEHLICDKEENNNNIINKELLLKSIKNKIKMLETDFMYIDTELSILRDLESEIGSNKYNGSDK